MTIRARTARRVCNQKEYDLFKESRRGTLGALDLKQLQKRDARAGKSLALARSRAQEAKAHFERGKITSRDYDDAVRRVEVLEEVKGRFDRRMKHKLLQHVGREQPKQRKRHVEIRRQLKVRPAARAKRVRKLAAVKKERLEEAANKRIQGHVSSRDRRAQILNDRRH